MEPDADVLRALDRRLLADLIYPVRPDDDRLFAREGERRLVREFCQGDVKLRVMAGRGFLEEPDRALLLRCFHQALEQGSPRITLEGSVPRWALDRFCSLKVEIVRPGMTSHFGLLAAYSGFEETLATLSSPDVVVDGAAFELLLLAQYADGVKH